MTKKIILQLKINFFFLFYKKNKFIQLIYKLKSHYKYLIILQCINDKSCPSKIYNNTF